MGRSKAQKVGIAVNAALLGMAVGMLWWSIADYPGHADTWDRLWVSFWVLATSTTTAFLIGSLHTRPRHRVETVPCGSCDGHGTGGPASDESTNGGCWDCLGEGRVPVWAP